MIGSISDGTRGEPQRRSPYITKHPSSAIGLTQQTANMSEFLPPMPLPPGGDQNRGAATYGAAISIVILSTTAVAARMYTRVCVIHNVGWDDHTIMITQVDCLSRKFILPMPPLTLISVHEPRGFRLSNTHHQSRLW